MSNGHKNPCWFHGRSKTILIQERFGWGYICQDCLDHKPADKKYMEGRDRILYAKPKQSNKIKNCLDRIEI